MQSEAGFGSQVIDLLTALRVTGVDKETAISVAERAVPESRRSGVIAALSRPNFDPQALTGEAPSSTWLGGAGSSAVGAADEHADDRGLELGQELVERQAAPVAFGSARSLCSVTNKCAAVTSVTWWCQPSQVRPSK